MPIRLPTLLFECILATVALVDSANRRGSKATITVTPGSTNILTNIFRNFDGMMESAATAILRSPALPSDDGNAVNHIDDAERIKFGFDEAEWKDFLRRMGFDEPGYGDDG